MIDFLACIGRNQADGDQNDEDQPGKDFPVRQESYSKTGRDQHQICQFKSGQQGEENCPQYPGDNPVYFTVGFKQSGYQSRE